MLGLCGHTPDDVADMHWGTVQRIVALHQLHNPLMKGP